MNIQGFTGAAGTGKTTSLLNALENHLADSPLESDQRVLALTFMHGARRRLHERLSCSTVRKHFECVTLDSFAWSICRRWRTRVRKVFGELCADEMLPDYDRVCEVACSLLDDPLVADWVARRYPLVVLDEFQDCASARLGLAKRLSEQVEMLIAADDFQNLSQSELSPGVAWLDSLGVANELTVNHRTSVSALIEVAHALRSGLPLPSETGTDFKLMSAPAAPVAASFITQTMVGGRKGDTVLLSASRPGTSPWVDEVVHLARTKKYGRRKAGPVDLRWEESVDAVAEEVCVALGASNSGAQIGLSDVAALDSGPIPRQLARWMERQRRLTGKTHFSGLTVAMQVRRAAQYARAFPVMEKTSSHRAMTIHQAKNREFGVVILLWPFTVVGNDELARRWLYNAVTRARRRAIVIVQDPSKNRLSQPPFA